MRDESKTKKQLISELTELRQQLANLKNFEEELNKLKESNDKFVKAFMHCSIPMTITTFKEGRFIDVNYSFLRFTGLRQDEIIGRTSREIGYITEEQRAILFNEIKKKGCVENLELKVGAKEGEIRDGLFNAVMMTLNNEKCLLKVMVDVTERKKAEYALRESEKKYREIFENAGKGIYQTTVFDVTEKKRFEIDFLQAKKMETVGTFSNGIAKDFNDIFLVIQECVSMLFSDIDSSHSYYKYLKNIETQVASGADLTAKLLALAGRGKYEVKPTSVDDIIDKASSIFGNTNKEISICRRCDQELGMVVVDPDQMQMMFMNLYENAWQTMPGGDKIHIKIENFLLDNNQAQVLSPDSKQSRYVKISITDTGMGMDESIREHIFDPFYMTNGRGTGLGLATVYGIIKGHGGMITVCSEPDQGTTFTIYLPALDKKVITQKAVKDAALKGGETILVVDDEKMVLEVTKELLESLGYQVYIAQSGQEAIDFYIGRKDQINLVILDMVLPGMSGGKIFDNLREINPDIRVLLASGYSFNGEAEQILARGCKGFLPKPFRLKELAQKVRETLN